MKIFAAIPPLHPEGYPFVGGLLLMSFLLRWFSGRASFVLMVLALLCAIFFRHPTRVPPKQPRALVSPADGIVSSIEWVQPPAAMGLGEEAMQRVSIFLSVFDVHVNRIPTDAKVTAMHYVPGAFISAQLDKSSEENERQLIAFQAHEGFSFGVVQIAGLIARRIVCDLKVDQEVQQGKPFGVIRFGSRVDLYVPKSLSLHVQVGQRMVGGETIIAEMGR